MDYNTEGDSTGLPMRAHMTAINSHQFLKRKIYLLIHAITTHLKKSGACKTKHIMLPFRPQFDQLQLEAILFQLFPQGRLLRDFQAWEYILVEYDDYTLLALLKYIWSRLPYGEVIGWEAYYAFRRQEREANYPRDAFITMMPKCLTSASHASIVYDFMDLLVSIAAHSTKNQMSGRKISKLSAIWAFNAAAPEQVDGRMLMLLPTPTSMDFPSDDMTFTKGLKAWVPATNAMFHLMLSFLRSMLPPDPQQLRLPKSLKTLLSSHAYPPPTSPSEDLAVLLKPTTVKVPVLTVNTTQASVSPRELIMKVSDSIQILSQKHSSKYEFLYTIFKYKSSQEIVEQLSPGSRRIWDMAEDDEVFTHDLHNGWMTTDNDYRDEPIQTPVQAITEISTLAVNDYEIWIWLSSISVEANTAIRGMFGRSLVLEFINPDTSSVSWVVIEEKVLREGQFRKLASKVTDREMAMLKRLQKQHPDFRENRASVLVPPPLPAKDFYKPRAEPRSWAGMEMMEPGVAITKPGITVTKPKAERPVQGLKPVNRTETMNPEVETAKPLYQDLLPLLDLVSCRLSIAGMLNEVSSTYSLEIANRPRSQPIWLTEQDLYLDTRLHELTTRLDFLHELVEDLRTLYSATSSSLEVDTDDVYQNYRTIMARLSEATATTGSFNSVDDFDTTTTTPTLDGKKRSLDLDVKSVEKETEKPVPDLFHSASPLVFSSFDPRVRSLDPTRQNSVGMAFDYDRRNSEDYASHPSHASIFNASMLAPLVEESQAREEGYTQASTPIRSMLDLQPRRLLTSVVPPVKPFDAPLGTRPFDTPKRSMDSSKRSMLGVVDATPTPQAPQALDLDTPKRSMLDVDSERFTPPARSRPTHSMLDVRLSVLEAPSVVPQLSKKRSMEPPLLLAPAEAVPSKLPPAPPSKSTDVVPPTRNKHKPPNIDIGLAVAYGPITPSQIIDQSPQVPRLHRAGPLTPLSVQVLTQPPSPVVPFSNTSVLNLGLNLLRSGSSQNRVYSLGMLRNPLRNSLNKATRQSIIMALSFAPGGPTTPTDPSSLPEPNLSPTPRTLHSRRSTTGSPMRDSFALSDYLGLYEHDSGNSSVLSRRTSVYVALGIGVVPRRNNSQASLPKQTLKLLMPAARARRASSPSDVCFSQHFRDEIREDIERTPARSVSDLELSPGTLRQGDKTPDFTRAESITPKSLQDEVKQKKSLPFEDDGKVYDKKIDEEELENDFLQHYMALSPEKSAFETAGAQEIINPTDVPLPDMHPNAPPAPTKSPEINSSMGAKSLADEAEKVTSVASSSIENPVPPRSLLDESLTVPPVPPKTAVKERSPVLSKNPAKKAPPVPTKSPVEAIHANQESANPAALINPIEMSLPHEAPSAKENVVKGLKIKINEVVTAPAVTSGTSTLDSKPQIVKQVIEIQPIARKAPVRKPVAESPITPSETSVATSQPSLAARQKLPTDSNGKVAALRLRFEQEINLLSQPKERELRSVRSLAALVSPAGGQVPWAIGSASLSPEPRPEVLAKPEATTEAKSGQRETKFDTTFVAPAPISVTPVPAESASPMDVVPITKTSSSIPVTSPVPVSTCLSESALLPRAPTASSGTSSSRDILVTPPPTPPPALGTVSNSTSASVRSVRRRAPEYSDDEDSTVSKASEEVVSVSDLLGKILPEMKQEKGLQISPELLLNAKEDISETASDVSVDSAGLKEGSRRMHGSKPDRKSHHSGPHPQVSHSSHPHPQGSQPYGHAPYGYYPSGPLPQGQHVPQPYGYAPQYAHYPPPPPPGAVYYYPPAAAPPVASPGENTLRSGSGKMPLHMSRSQPASGQPHGYYPHGPPIGYAPAYHYPQHPVQLPPRQGKSDQIIAMMPQVNHGKPHGGGDRSGAGKKNLRSAITNGDFGI
ncbi:hypothetical protein BABINDRAFT_5953 [Babjeviella inositovora NRRL Y-12698]|uniref:Meiotically up-regulated protein Msb1/Mug8 domain-containing protein n=1 Tax=Babjeviella inositovora NRRL Y-12698 TaxID=984486 RepID=A0A1E3QZL2_9ASCO|nr:uncharacterized protein BABINDRAFT_5953 [Babjeviella inositovora NRRL Y-12698]ODQ83086.1 hypothetical protein BABINDRAFT_5953 [Babjeviella inositovora NRRL Y-12698]